MIAGELAMFLSYSVVSYLLAFYLRRRHVKVLGKVFLVLAVVFLLCGLTHAVASLMFLWPAYWVEAVVNVASGAAALTAIAILVPMLPAIMKFPSASRMEKVNLELREEVAQLMEYASRRPSELTDETLSSINSALASLRRASQEMGQKGAS